MSKRCSLDGRRISKGGPDGRRYRSARRVLGPLGLLAALGLTDCILFDWDYDGSDPTGGVAGSGGGAAGAGGGGQLPGTGGTGTGAGGLEQGGTGDGGASGAAQACPDPGEVCVAIPAGWSGPVVLYDGPAGGVTGCPAEHPDTVFSGMAGLVNEPAICAACTCTPPSKSCKGHGFTPYGDAACTVDIAWNSEGVSNMSCGAVTSTGVLGINVKQPTVTVNGCMPGGGVASVPPPVWSGAALMCAAAAPPRCTASEGVCVTPPPAPLVPGVCIWHAGNVNCPVEFPDRHVLGQEMAVTDTRGCTTCTCPQDFSCAPAFHFYTTSDCSGVPSTINQYDTCVPLAMASNISSYNVTWGSVMGSCPPTGGQPTGQIVPKDPVSVCCQ